MASHERYRTKDNCKCCDVPRERCGKIKGRKGGKVTRDREQKRSWRKDAYEPNRLNGGKWYSSYE